MPTFDVDAWARGDEDWALFQNGYVHLYWRSEVLGETVSWLRSRGYQIFDVGSGAWSEPDDMHSDLTRTFQFPDYYGRNLNALHDCLLDVALYGYGARPDTAGTVLVLRHFNAFARSHRDVAQALLDIYAHVARMAMLVGHRMLCLVQSDDPAIEFDPVGAAPVMWNPREWLQAKRMP